MVRNRIFQLRKDAKLTQRELALRVGTSQQQIQLDVATRIADALGVKLYAVFPGLPKSMKARAGAKQSIENLERRLASAGIDSDPRVWSIKLFMFDGRTFDFQIAGDDKERLESIISSVGKRFLVFNSKGRVLAVNRSRIAACQFLFDPPSTIHEEDKDDNYKLRLHLVSAISPISFDVEPDSKPLDQDEEGFQSQLQFLLLNLDGNDDDEAFSFDDVDGERVYIRANEVLLIDVPLICCEPSLFEASFESFEEDEGQLSQSPGHQPLKTSHGAD
jgi:transcriptional regulator with XRE-family HTH domain